MLQAARGMTKTVEGGGHSAVVRADADEGRRVRTLAPSGRVCGPPLTVILIDGSVGWRGDAHSARDAQATSAAARPASGVSSTPLRYPRWRPQAVGRPPDHGAPSRVAGRRPAAASRG